MNVKIGDELFLSNREGSLILRATPLIKDRTNADRVRGMSDKKLMNFLISVFCEGMAAENRGDDFDHSFAWTLDWLRQPAEEVHDGQTV